jgi:hypothetical protein
MNPMNRTRRVVVLAVPGHNEEAWRYNRRSELGYAALTSADS